jgi:hypothetical protein
MIPCITNWVYCGFYPPLQILRDRFSLLLRIENKLLILQWICPRMYRWSVCCYLYEYILTDSSLGVSILPSYHMRRDVEYSVTVREEWTFSICARGVNIIYSCIFQLYKRSEYCLLMLVKRIFSTHVGGGNTVYDIVQVCDFLLLQEWVKTFFLCRRSKFFYLGRRSEYFALMPEEWIFFLFV